MRSTTPGRATVRATAALLVALLIAAPALAQGSPTSDTSLHMAVLVGDVDAVQHHIQAGTDLNERDAYGSTPLTIAATFGRADATRALLDAGADPDLTDANGSTPLHIAAFLGRTAIVRALLDHGADKYVRNDAGRTALGSVTLPFDELRPTYDDLARGLAPLGLALDYDHIRAERPLIADMLRPSADELAAVQYAPVRGGAWPVSTPEDQGLDPAAVAEVYLNAATLDNLYSLLVIKDGHLIGERYFNGVSMEQKTLVQSVTKSFTSALLGLALEQGCLTSLDQRMLEYFPVQADRVTDPRKRQITLRQMLQMRAGYPWEETDATLWDGLVSGDYLRLVSEFPLSADPGTTFQYSNLTSAWLADIVARACGTDLLSFAQEHLFGPLGIEPGEWWQDVDGYYIGLGTLHLSARDAARFGLLYLQGGAIDGRQIIPTEWVRDSLRTYSEHAWPDVGAFHNIGYGYQWWTATVGNHHVQYAWGHGGQLIVLIPDRDMVVVATSDPHYPGPRGDAESWHDEAATLSLVSGFIRSLPGD